MRRAVLIVIAILLLLASADLSKAVRATRVSIRTAQGRREVLQ